MPTSRKPQLLRSPNAERSRGPLWAWPAGWAAVAFVSAALLTHLRPADGWGTRLWPADHSGAGILLQAVITAAVTITTLTFSLTVVALQLASQQFSPRLLRRFVHDAVTKRVLSVLTATFVFAMVTLRGLDSESPVPSASVLVSAVLGLCSFGAVLAFISHVVRELRVDQMMIRVHDDTDRAIAELLPDYAELHPAELPVGLGPGRLVLARRSGFVAGIDVAELVGSARRAQAVVRVEVRPGDHVLVHTPLATVWDSGAGDLTDDEARDALDIGNERTLAQDVAFGLRQLEDIAVRSMSPAVNDPVTAATAIGHLGDLLARLCDRRLGPRRYDDEDGAPRVLLLGRELRYFLELSCGQIRRYGAAEPTVLLAILRMLRDVAAAARDDHQRAELSRMADLVVDHVPDDAHPEDVAAIEALRDQVAAVVRGDLVEGYADEHGGSRSI